MRKSSEPGKYKKDHDYKNPVNNFISTLITPREEEIKEI